MSRKRKVEYIDHVRVRRNPVEMLIEAIKSVFGWLCRFFAPANIKHGMRSVTSSFREFAVFFVALFLVQIVFWSLFLATDFRMQAIKDEAYKSSDYHLRINGFTRDEWASVESSNFYVAGYMDPEDRHYISYKSKEYVNFASDTLVSVEFLLCDDTPESQSKFLQTYNLSGSNISFEYSRRATYLDEINAMQTVRVVLIVISGLLSALVLVVLYNIRINHFKFKYGIYMSFGADYEKLLHTSAWELISISLLTGIPATLIGCLIEFLVVTNIGSQFAFNPIGLLYFFIWNVCVVLLSVFPSLRILADRTPVSLIVAGDNSNYVSSPKVSFRIFRKNYPVHYELFGFWRFRRYYVTLLLSSILFTSLFLCGSFAIDMVKEEERMHRPQYSLTAKTGEEIEDYVLLSVIESDGVHHVLWENSVSASSVSSYCVLDAKQRSGISSKTVKAKQDGKYADNNFKYMLLDDLLCAQAQKEGAWEIEGDLGRVLTEQNCVAVTKYINNKESLGFEVGDEIILAKFKESLVPISFDKLDKKYILSQLVKEGIYDFYTVEIAAVVDTFDNDDEYSIILGEELFSEIVGKQLKTTIADIYTARKLSYEETDRIFEAIRAKLSVFDRVSLVDLGANADENINAKSSFIAPVLTVSVILLLISPLVWFFSQSMFSSKRSGENAILSAFGATDKQIGQMYLFSGGALSLPACVVTVLLGFGVTSFAYWLINEFLTSLGLGSDARFVYVFSITGVLVCIAVSVASAVISTYLPFVKWKRERDRIIKRHSGDISKRDEDK